jgi:hypothetical protein
MMKKTSKKNAYQKPRILHQGQLKQFAGSPLGKPLKGNPLGLPGQN